MPLSLYNKTTLHSLEKKVNTSLFISDVLIYNKATSHSLEKKKLLTQRCLSGDILH